MIGKTRKLMFTKRTSAKLYKTLKKRETCRPSVTIFFEANMGKLKNQILMKNALFHDVFIQRSGRSFLETTSVSD